MVTVTGAQALPAPGCNGIHLHTGNSSDTTYIIRICAPAPLSYETSGKVLVCICTQISLTPTVLFISLFVVLLSSSKCYGVAEDSIISNSALRQKNSLLPNKGDQKEQTG